MLDHHSRTTTTPLDVATLMLVGCVDPPAKITGSLKGYEFSRRSRNATADDSRPICRAGSCSN